MSTVVPVSFVSIEEYLSTNYEPDMDYVDGVLVDRNVGSMTIHGCSAPYCWR